MKLLYVAYPSIVVVFLQLSFIRFPNYDLSFAPFIATVFLFLHLTSHRLNLRQALLAHISGVFLYFILIYFLNSLFLDVNHNEFIKTFSIYLFSSFLYILMFSITPSAKYIEQIQFGLLFASIILSLVTLLQLIGSLGFLKLIDSTPIWSVNTIGSNFDNIRTGRYQDVGMTLMLNSFFSRPCAFYYEPSWVGLVANSLLVSNLIIHKSCTNFLHNFNHITKTTTLLSAITVIFSFSTSAILFLPTFFVANFARTLFSGKLRLKSHTKNLIALSLSLCFFIVYSLYSSSKIFNLFQAGTSAWYRIFNPFVSVVDFLHVFAIAVPLGNINEIPSFLGALTLYFGLLSPLVLFLSYIFIRKTFISMASLDLLKSKKLDSVFSLLILYITYLMLSTGAVLTPETVVMSSIVILAFKLSLIIISVPTSL